VSDAVIYDRGYRSYEGERRGRSAIRRAIARDGIRRILGLRRKARRKILPWSLLVIGVVMAAVIIGLHFVAGSLAAGLEEGLPSYPDLFDLYSRIALLFIAVTGPELLIPDRTQGVLSVYFSRPMRVSDYLTGKLIAYLTVAGAIYVVPQLLLHLGLAGLSDAGFLSYLGSNLDILWKVPAVALGFLAVHGGLLAILSSLIDRTGFAAAAYLAILIAGNGIAGVIADAGFAGSRYVSLLALDDHARFVRDWVFGSDLGLYRPEESGFEPWVSAVSIAVVAVFGAWFAYRRYRKQA
jgi:ABC-type transport system involved in multi-copper enzyme maturation permease subunit